MVSFHQRSLIQAVAATAFLTLGDTFNHRVQLRYKHLIAHLLVQMLTNNYRCGDELRIRSAICTPIHFMVKAV